MNVKLRPGLSRAVETAWIFDPRLENCGEEKTRFEESEKGVSVGEAIKERNFRRVENPHLGYVTKTIIIAARVISE